MVCSMQYAYAYAGRKHELRDSFHTLHDTRLQTSEQIRGRKKSIKHNDTAIYMKPEIGAPFGACINHKKKTEPKSTITQRTGRSRR